MILVLMLIVASVAMSAEVAKTTDAAATTEIGPYKATTIAAAKESGVDTAVQLRGTVIKMLKANEFLLDDGTGELMVFTEEGALNGMDIVNATVEVTGQIGQNFMYTEVEATSVKVVE
jgi:uncharacterized protein (TIGR00156 family)